MWGILVSPHCLDDHSFVIQLEIWNCDASGFAFFIRTALVFRGLWWFHTNFKIVLFHSVKNSGGILIEIALNVDFFWYYS